MQTNSTNSTQNHPTFQLQDRTHVVSRIPELPDESNLVSTFPSILDENKASPRVLAQPNTTSHNNPMFQLENRTQVVSRTQVCHEVEKTGLEQFHLLSYIRSVSVLKFSFKLNIDIGGGVNSLFYFSI